VNVAHFVLFWFIVCALFFWVWLCFAFIPVIFVVFQCVFDGVEFFTFCFFLLGMC
jgi:hypothetical protein